MDRTPLDSDFALMLHRLRRWWSEPRIPPRLPRSLRWGGEDIGAIARRVDVSDADLHVSVRTQRPVAPGAVRHSPLLEKLRGAELTGETEDGWSFFAASAAATSWRTQVASGEVDETVDVVGWRWTLGRTDVLKTPRAHIWVSELRWTPPAYVGNLALWAGDGGSHDNYFLEGPECDYVALSLEGKERWALVARERQPGAMTHDSLYRDMNALAFAFGTPFEVEQLFAVDAQLDVTGVMGGGLMKPGVARATPEEGPVPSTNDLASLPVVMFNTLAAHINERGTAACRDLTLATWYYLESLEEKGADSSVLKMTMALVMASRYLLGAETSVVQDPSAFLAWLQAQGSVIATFERKDRPGALQRALHVTAAESGPRAIVDLALAKAKLTPTNDLRAALFVGLGSLSGEALPPGRLFDVFPQLRALAAAVIARGINYRGRLSGWKRVKGRSFYGPTPNQWWDGDTDLAATTYAASIADVVPELNLWPRVSTPTVPTDGVVGLVSRYAAGLASQTEGRLYAELRPLPRRIQDTFRRYQFTMRVTQQPNTKIVLFVLRETDDGVTVDGWSSDVLLRETQDVEAFLRDVAVSAEAHEAIEYLLLAALDVERNEPHR